MIGLDAAKAGVALLFAAVVQISIAAWIEVGEGRPDVVLVLLVAIALLRGPTFGAVAGFWAGLILDVASLGTVGLTSLLFTVAGYASGRFGEVTTRSSAHPPLIAAALASLGVACGSAVLHFMLGESISASEFFVGVLLPGLALNMLLAYPVYGLTRRLLPSPVKVRRGGVRPVV